MALVLHELATNSAKDGALSVPDGRLIVNWKVAPQVGAGQACFVFSWLERGGPPVTVPLKHGFGLQMIAALLKHAQHVSFDHLGFELRVEIPLAEVIGDSK